MNRLLACRVCLAYDTRLCSIMDGQFRNIYEKLVEASLDTEDMLPTSACYLCVSVMKKILHFRDRSQKANQILQQMISSGLEPSLSSLDMLVKDQTGISWTLGITDVERTTTTSGEAEFEVKIASVKSEIDIDGMSDRNVDEAELKVKIESVKLEMDIDEISDRNEDYSERMPVYRDSTSDSDDDLPLHNISEQRKTDRVKIVKTPEALLTEMISGHEGAAPPEKRKLEKNEAENELVNIQTPLIKTRKDKEPREKKEVLYFKEVKMATSNIISENQKSAFNKNYTVTPSKDILTCDLCNKEYQYKILLESHMRKAHVMEFTRKDSITSDLNVANECKSTNLLKVTYQKIQNNNKRKENNRRKNKLRGNTSQSECPYCMKRFTSNFQLTGHVRVHTKEKPFKCVICGKCFSLRSGLKKHSRVHTKEQPFKCDICEKSFPTSSNLNTHLKVHTKEKPFECDTCGKCFTQSFRLITHLRVHNNGKPFKCNICGKRFTHRCHLTRHLRGHTKAKPFKCDICGKCFAQSSYLIRHLRGHTQENPFKCDICGKCFTKSYNLSRHLRGHTKEKPFKCDICGKCFSQSWCLSRHLRVHTKEKPFKCDICKKCFTEKSSVTNHLRIHTKEKPFKCDICEKSFSRSSHLTRHLRFHTKEKHFKCDICEKCFTEKSHLTRHLRFHTKEKPFKCGICGKCFTQSCDLSRHLKVHTKVKPFECDQTDHG